MQILIFTTKTKLFIEYYSQVGHDFGSPKFVKCIKVLQARVDYRECCDPADILLLDRWDGSM